MSLYQQGVTLKALLENPELLNPPKLNKETKEKKDGELVENDLFLGQSAFLGPTLWDKTLPVDVSDFKLEYMDLDEFLNENGLVDNPENNDKKEEAIVPLPTVPKQQPPPPKQPESLAEPSPVEPQHPATSSDEEKPPKPNSSEAEIPHPKSPVVHVDFDVAESDLALATIPDSNNTSAMSPCPSSAGEDVDFEVPEGDLALVTVPGQKFDPKKRAFTEEELRPQPMIKKSKKVFVPEDLKDDRYWQRRKKNNVAAKRSRDARRIKENQIAMRASFLERENDKYKEELEKIKSENKILFTHLLKYEPDFKLGV